MNESIKQIYDENRKLKEKITKYKNIKPLKWNGKEFGSACSSKHMIPKSWNLMV